MTRKLRNFVLVAALLASAAGALWFAALIRHEYEHSHEVVLILKTGAYPDPSGLVEADHQGRMEAYAQLGAYSMCVALFVASALGLLKRFRKG